jgi:hypothetical protein
VWTGKSGVGSLGGLLSDPKLQSLTQNEIMIGALDGLKSAGIVTGNESPKDLASFVQTASKFGVDNTVSWVKGVAPSDIVNQITATAKNAQYAIDFVNNKSTELVTGGLQLGGFTGTVERSALDTALQEVISDAKIPAPNYSSGLYSNIPSDELNYTAESSDIEIKRIETERAERGLSQINPTVEVQTGDADARSSNSLFRNQTGFETRIVDTGTGIFQDLQSGSVGAVQKAGTIYSSFPLFPPPKNRPSELQSLQARLESINREIQEYTQEINRNNNVVVSSVANTAGARESRRFAGNAIDYLRKRLQELEEEKLVIQAEIKRITG